MIYFDNAATTWPKPPEVVEEISRCIKEYGANPGRGGHKKSVVAHNMVNNTRLKLAHLFNIESKYHNRIVFTLNATEAINLALKGFIKKGEHVITSSMEHNALSRPLKELVRKGAETTKIQCDHEGRINIDNIEAAIRPNTKLIAITHASNVTGTLMPITEIGHISKKYGITLLVDAAQTAGLVDIDVVKMNIGMLAFPGHKCLLGPTGTGGLYIEKNIELDPLKEGGTGSYSEMDGMPHLLPDRYEAGTINTVGIAGLSAGIDFIIKEGREKIRNHELDLTSRFLSGVLEIPGIKVFGPQNLKDKVPVVSFIIEGLKTQQVGDILDREYDIASRAGLHCAPDAHKTLGTYNTMSVRFSFSYYNTADEVDQSLIALKNIAGRAKLY